MIDDINDDDGCDDGNDDNNNDDDDDNRRIIGEHSPLTIIKCLTLDQVQR